jgi:DNA-binding beta-propeller fold protein YncE
MRFQCASEKLPFLLVALLCCLALTPTANAQAQFAYVTNDGGSIELINTTTNSVINTLQLPGVAAPYKATSVAVTPDGAKVYVTTDSPSGIFVLDATAANVLSTIPLPACSIVVSKDGARAYVGSSVFGQCSDGARSLSTIDIATNTVISTIAGVAANQVALTPDGTRAYLTGNALYGGQGLIVIDTKRNTIVPHSLPIQPWGAAATPDGKFVYLTGYSPLGSATPAIFKIDPSTNSLVSIVTLPAGLFFVGSITISSDGARAYVMALTQPTVSTNQIVESLLVIDTATDAVIATVSPFGASGTNTYGFGTVALTATGSKVYLTHNTLEPTSTGSIAVIDTSSNSVIALLPDNNQPTSIAVSPGATGPILTVDFTDRAAFAAATTNLSRVGFAGILPPGVQFGGYSRLDVPGVSFSTPVSNTFINVTTAGYYSPNVYPTDFIVDSVNQATGQPNPNNTLFIALTQPTFAVGLDVGGLGFSGIGAGTITLSNGHVFSIASLPTVGNTTFVGFISTQPITNLTFSTTNDSWVVEDLLIANPIVPSCTFSLSPSGQAFKSQGGLATFFVNTGAGCAWTPTFNDSWLTPFPFLIPHIVFPGGGPTFGTSPGPGKVSFIVAPNLGARRSGSISVSNQTFHVDQEGGTPVCTFSINPLHAVIDDLGGNLRVAVTAPGGCAWTAASNAGWLSVASSASGSGNATVTIHAASNTGGARTGTVTIAGRTFTVTQGGGACGALDVTAKTAVTLGGLTLLQFTSFIYSGTITVRNNSDVTLHPPLYVVLVGLPNHLADPYGVGSNIALQTTCFTPAGDYMYLLSTGDLPPGGSISFSPLFYTLSLFGNISYHPRVLSGTPTH